MPSARPPWEDLKEYEKIVRLRDDIVAGKHPRLKAVPKSTTQKAALRPGQAGAASLSPDFAPTRTSLTIRASDVNGDKENNSGPSPASSQRAASSQVTGKTKSAPVIDPMLPEKPKDLKNSEIRLKRQAIEKELRDEVELKRSKVHTCEEVSEIDLGEVLIKALQRVQAALPSLQPEEAQGTHNVNSSPASDSFDDNTFYSSQDNTPSSKLSNHQNPNTQDDIDMLDDYEPSMPPEPVVPISPQPPPAERPSGMQSNEMQNSFLPLMSGALAGLASLPHHHAAAVAEALAAHASANVSRNHSDGNTGTDQNADQRYRNKGSLQPPFEPREQPLVRSHDLSPVAPRPAHISSLTTAREQPTLSDQGVPAQVPALKRVEAVGGNTSPDSSPQTANNRKKNKKKKRKAEKQAIEPISPLIKTEPWSPSPNLAAPAFERPSKRQRQSGGAPRHGTIPVQDLTYDDRRYEPAQAAAQSERYPPSGQYMEERHRPVAYDGTLPRTSTQRPPSIVDAARYDRDLIEDRQPPTHIIRPPRSPGTYVQYTEAPPPPPRSVMPASQTHYREYPTEGSRMSVRPEYIQERDRSPIMGPPRAATRTVYVDQHGREYMEPSRTTMVRHSVAPLGGSVRPGGSGGAQDPEVMYERTAAIRHRATSRRPEAYDDGMVISRRAASPSLSYRPPSRRVITQPTEYATASAVVAPSSSEYYHRSSYPTPAREYSVRPAVEEYVPSRPQIERRFDEISRPRDFQHQITRPSTVRPSETAAIRYAEIPAAADYATTRIQSVRPDMQFREFSTTGGRIGGSSSGTSYPHAPPPLASMGDNNRTYYDSSRPQHLRGGAPHLHPHPHHDEIAFIEAPRGPTQEIVYADDMRREVYR